MKTQQEKNMEYRILNIESKKSKAFFSLFFLPSQIQHSKFNIQNSTTKGFTLIELLVVIAIISVLSGVVLQSLSSTRAKSRDAVRLQNIESIAKGFQVATTGANGGQFPLRTTYTCLGKSPCWNGAYTSAVDGVLLQGLSGSIPLDPLYKTTELGDAYLYNSNEGSVAPNGVALYWRMESTGTCGRGVSAGGQYCRLYLGPPVL